MINEREKTIPQEMISRVRRVTQQQTYSSLQNINHGEISLKKGLIARMDKTLMPSTALTSLKATCPLPPT